eukprot:CAMPEP_0115340762 /NCGR_PEP_ID=MMETSP0270-20121206/91316_1 /TAXON_ID=71861 /ORGANISM="Scrippsiella trochoidea, Strain CCMP3099" /LENGTH=138 /DNA_ID=CAMNT_0002762231 /DNA_START=19 /DNA_END=432 /DNA_ORIENTATION=+
MTMFFLSFCLWCLYEFIWYHYLDSECSRRWQAYLCSVLLSFLFFGRTLILCFAPLAGGDLSATRHILCIDAMAVLASDAETFAKSTLWADTAWTAPYYSRFVAYGICNLTLTCGFLRAMRCTEAISMQRRMWTALRIW